MNIRRELTKGTLWTGAGRYGNFLLQLVVTAILSRLLTPADFGILSMVVVFTGFINLMATAGLSATVVQLRDIDDLGLSTVFWLSSGISLIMSVLLILGAPAVEIFYSMDGLSIVIQVMSINILLLGLQSVPRGRLLRNLKFRQMAFIEIGSYLVAGAVAITLALTGAGYWALVAQVICVSGIQLIGFFVGNKWFPKLTFRRSIVREVLGFSNYVLGFNMINYWARNADNLMIGRYLGATSLGYYSQAYKLMTLPIQLVTGVITPSLHPVLSIIQDDRKRMASAYLKLVELIAFISFPLGVFLFLFAGPVIRILWGNQWSASIPVFEVLAILTMFQPVVSTSGSVFLASNQARVLFGVGIANSAIMVTGIIIGLPFGIVGVALGYTVAYLVFVFPITFYFLARTLDKPFRRMFMVFIKPASISVGLVPFLVVFRSVQMQFGDLALLASGLGITIIAGFVGAYFLYREQLFSGTKLIWLRWLK